MRTRIHNGRKLASAEPAYCAIYCRGNDRLSIKAQKRACTELVMKNSAGHWKIYGRPYVDFRLSGTNRNRPALQQLLKDAASQKFQIIICQRHDRLTRNSRDYFEIIRIFRNHGLQLWIADGLNKPIAIDLQYDILQGFEAHIKSISKRRRTRLVPAVLPLVKSKNHPDG